MNLQHVLYAVADRIATVTVTRPDKLNALNDAVMADIGAAMAAAKADPAVGVVVLTGAGEKAFVAGADIGELAKQTVIGGNAHPFYRWIAEELGEAGTPRWNFHKYLIGPDGAIAGAWPSAVTPESKGLAAAIKQALAG